MRRVDEIYWAPVEETMPIPHNKPVPGASDGRNRDDVSDATSGVGCDDSNAGHAAY